MTTTDHGAVILIGASSPIMRALADIWAARGHALALAGRDLADIDRIAADVIARHRVPVRTFEFDVLKRNDVTAWLQSVAAGDHIHGVVIAVADTGDEERARIDDAYARYLRQVNFSDLIPLLEASAELVATGGGRFVVAIGSVAGDRPRRSNYTYGAAKQELAAFMMDLRRRFEKRSVSVLTVKPGYVDTRMTWHRPSPLTTTPDRAARDIVRAVDSCRDVVYTPWFWRWIMLMVRVLPRPLFKLLEKR